MKFIIITWDDAIHLISLRKHETIRNAIQIENCILKLDMGDFGMLSSPGFILVNHPDPV